MIDIDHKLQDVDSLHFGCEDSQSRKCDWREGYGENWTSYGTTHLDCQNQVECDQCDGGLVDQHEDGVHPIPCDECDGTGAITCPFDGPSLVRSGLCECPECGNEVEDDADEPMMNYYYPLPDHKNFDADDALKLDGLSLCLVNFSDSDWRQDEPDDRPDWALALTGGGMDLNWDIAEAYMRLGLLPPLFTCRLPKFAGKNMAEPHAAWVIAGCKRTAQAVADNALRYVEELDRLAEPS